MIVGDDDFIRFTLIICNFTSSNGGRGDVENSYEEFRVDLCKVYHPHQFRKRENKKKINNLKQKSAVKDTRIRYQRA